MQPGSMGQNLPLQNRRPNFIALNQAEKYLCPVLYPKENCNTFDNL